MISLEAVTNATPNDIKHAANAVRAKLTTLKRAYLLEAVGLAWTPGKKAKTYRVTVQVHKISPQVQFVWCHCTCARFRYACEYVLAHAGSSTFVAAIDSPPKVMNPELLPWVCKHIWAAISTLEVSK